MSTQIQTAFDDFLKNEVYRERNPEPLDFFTAGFRAGLAHAARRPKTDEEVDLTTLKVTIKPVATGRPSTTPTGSGW